MIVARRTASTLTAAIAALAVLAAPAPADAQTRKRSAPAASTASAPKAIQVPLPPPPAAAAPRVAPVAAPVVAAAPESSFAILAGPFVALKSGDGFAVTLDYGRTATPPRWTRAALELHLPVTFARPSDAQDLVNTVTFMGQTYRDVYGSREDSASLLEVIPTARVRMPLAAARGVSVFADGGLGLAFGLVHAVVDERYQGRTTTNDAAVALALRLAAGVAYDATPRLRVLVQPVVLTMHAGTDWSSYTALVGLSYRL